MAAEAARASVVVAAFSGAAALEACLASLEPQRAGAEVLVVAPLDDGTRRLAARFEWARFLDAPAGSSVFERRALGVAAARGDVVALVEDHCTLVPGWLEALLGAQAAGHAVAGGPVENGLTARVWDWALYLVEYGAHLPPLPAGPAPILSGVNIAYTREALERCRATWAQAFYENEVHAALSGTGLHRAPQAVVTAHLRLAPRAAWAHLFAGGRRYGLHRRARVSALQRVLLPLLAPGVPALLLGRLLRTLAARRPALLGIALRGLPAVLSLLLAWSAGEALGYLPGREGRD